ncbi:MAG: IS21 family transposase [Bacteroidetes bacterium]|nr:IS21 family transposase [Bacteroidota bacterium]
MANNRINMLTVKQIIQLKNQGISSREIARRTGIGRNTVNDYIKQLKRTKLSYKALLQLTESQLEELFPKASQLSNHKYEKLLNLLPGYEKQLKKVGCTYQVLWFQYKSNYPAGYSYTQFKHHFHAWQDKQQVSMHVEHKMGDKLFVDYAGKKLQITDRVTGETKQVEVFVALLGGSQYTYVEATQSQQKEDFIKTLSNSLHYFGGVPQAIVPDNLKSAVNKSNNYEPILNKHLKAFGLHYNTTILPTRSYKPRDKALVEGAVKLVYQRIFYSLQSMTFFSLHDLNTALHKQLEKYNDYLFQGRDYSRKTLFISSEKSQLQSLPLHPFELKSYKRARVQKNSHIWLGDDKHYYSVPYQYAARQVELQYSKSVIEVYFNNERIATHARSQRLGGYTTEKQHMPSTHQFVSEWSADFFLKWAKPRGKIIEQYIENIFAKKAHPEQAYKSCMGIQQLYKQYGNERLTDACQRALQYQRYGYHVLKNILEKGLDKITLEEQLSLDFIEQHDNIRGASYYQ